MYIYLLTRPENVICDLSRSVKYPSGTQPMVPVMTSIMISSVQEGLLEAEGLLDIHQLSLYHIGIIHK